MECGGKEDEGNRRLREWKTKRERKTRGMKNEGNVRLEEWNAR
jgi:hypothetical protein